MTTATASASSSAARNRWALTISASCKAGGNGWPGGLVLSPEPQTEAGQQLRLFLEPKWEAVQQDAMVVKGSYRALAREIGYANPDDTKPVRECIERLWKVSIIAQNGRKRQGFRLLSEYASDEQDGKLYVALNPLIARAVMGGAQHVRIDMDEVRRYRPTLRG